MIAAARRSLRELRVRQNPAYMLARLFSMICAFNSGAPQHARRADVPGIMFHVRALRLVAKY
jgi:hypothetical protein